MAVPQSPRRWSQKERALRLALAVVIAGLGYEATVQSLAMVVQRRSPSQAHALAPDNGFITGELSNKLSGPEAGAQDRFRADHLARLALQQDPTALHAVVTLGLNALVRGDVAMARRLFGYSESLSRRDLPTQMWDINDEHNGVSAVLLHYDIALRTSRNASTLLFPVLASAISNPTIRASLVKTLARRPVWADGFIYYVIGSGTDLEAMTSLFYALLHQGFVIPDNVSASLISALIGAKRLDQAWAYYTAIHPDADRRRSRDPDFKNNNEAPSPLDWVPINDGSISAVIQPRDSDGGALSFTAPTSVGGPVVQQIELLPPGNYILNGRSEGIDQSSDARPFWSLNCLDGHELGRIDLPNSAAANGRFSGRFTVSADCPVQALKLNIRPSDKITGISAQIDRALLQPVGKMR